MQEVTYRLLTYRWKFSSMIKQQIAGVIEELIMEIYRAPHLAVGNIGMWSLVH